jgi:predicted transcriptional regulator with HTH domain
MTNAGLGPEVRVSLRKSKVRREVLEYLVNIYPKKVYASEIAEETEIGLNDVYGALNGVLNRYKKENSLVSLGLVTKEKTNGICFYFATELGCRSCRSLIK